MAKQAAPGGWHVRLCRLPGMAHAFQACDTQRELGLTQALCGETGPGFGVQKGKRPRPRLRSSDTMDTTRRGGGGGGGGGVIYIYN